MSWDHIRVWSTRTRDLMAVADNLAERASVLAFIAKYAVSWARSADSRDVDCLIRVGGLKFAVGLRGGETATLGEVFRARIYARVPGFEPKAGWTVIDVGANVGVFAAVAAARGARVLAIEPSVRTFRRLERTVAANAFETRVVPINCAAGDSAGRGTLRDAPMSIHASVEFNAAAAGATAVRVETIDALAPAFTAGVVNLLKIDVEGAEIEVLKGASRTLRQTDRVVVEYHSRPLRTAVASVLTDAGFAIQQAIDLYGDIGVLYASRVRGEGRLDVA